MMGITDKAVATSSFFQTIFNKGTNEDSPALLDQNPQEIAVKLISVEHEYWNSLLIMEQKKSLLVSKLETSEDIEKVKFNDELKKLDMEIEAYKSTKQQYAKQLNDLIAAKNLEEMKEIEAVSANVDKITVKDQQDKVRSFKKILHFSDFKRRLESYYPGTIFMLTRAGSNEVVGSQDEFYFAFKDVAQGEKTLALDLTVSNKRKITEDDTGSESDASSSPQLIQHTGLWKDAEIERFKMGVNTHGWGNWTRVAKEVATRTRKQVSKFSENNLAKRLRQTDSITGAWVNLAAGLDRVSKGLEEK
jgi:hypothetical protein